MMSLTLLVIKSVFANPSLDIFSLIAIGLIMVFPDRHFAATSKYRKGVIGGKRSLEGRGHWREGVIRGKGSLEGRGHWR